METSLSAGALGRGNKGWLLAQAVSRWNWGWSSGLHALWGDQHEGGRGGHAIAAAVLKTENGAGGIKITQQS